MKKRILRRLAAVAVLAAFAGCRSDQYYQSAAVDDAREFLLDNAPELTQEEVFYVRYNDPVFLKGEALGDPKNAMGSWEHTDSYLRQICVAWRIPTREELYMVCGFSEERMHFWKPNRLLRKKFVKEEKVQEKMLAAAQTCVRNRILGDLSTREYNHVRFDYPTLLRTDLDVNFNGNGILSDEEIAERKNLVAAMNQYSLVWGEDDRRIVVSGFADSSLSGWSPIFAAVLTAEELNSHTLEMIRTPENFKLPLEEEK
ncbi:MAG: hypothetical protein MJ016_07390 [Victivallaceae bacterium]|nr:hypothetical protein [Victivallaceae bacterium]